MSAHLITLKCGLTDPGARPETGSALRDVITGRRPVLWAGARTDVRLIFENPTTGAALVVTDWALVTFRLLGQDRTTLYASRTVDPDDFVPGPPKETTIALTTTETTRAPGEYWLAVFATLTSGGLLPLYAGPINIENGGLTTTAPADPEAEPVYTQAQIDALFGAGSGGVYASDGNGFLLVGAVLWTWPVAPVGSSSGAGVTVLSGNALLSTVGLLWTWPVAETTYIPGAPVAQILNGNLLLTIGSKTYTSPAAVTP